MADSRSLTGLKIAELKFISSVKTNEKGTYIAFIQNVSVTLLNISI